jgi:hypothetical protein
MIYSDEDDDDDEWMIDGEDVWWVNQSMYR